MERHLALRDRKTVVRMSVLPKGIYTFNSIPIKTDIEKVNPQIHNELHPLNCRNNPEREQSKRTPISFIAKLTTKATVNIVLTQRQTLICINQWNRTEFRNKPIYLWPTDFQKGCQAI